MPAPVAAAAIPLAGKLTTKKSLCNENRVREQNIAFENQRRGVQQRGVQQMFIVKI